jgi:predicted transcriptional regulator/DNA-directed RNA polymerase subunit RPC12/RpoP
MMALYFDGYSESAIAHRLKIDQSTVSLYVSKFKFLVEQQGIKAAGQEFGIMHEVEELHSLAVELKKSKLTIEEAKLGLNTVQSLQGLGIKQEEYLDVIQGCAKAKSEGYMTDTIKLSKLEKSTGMTHEELVAQYVSTQEQLKKDQQALHITTGKLKATVEELAAKENQKKLADQDLAAHLKKVGAEKKQASQDLAIHMKQVGLDANRLALVEDLAIALKEGSVSDKDLGQYIKRQKHLNQTGISLDNLITIVKQAKVMTADDGGKALAEKLSQFGSLDVAIEARQNKLSLLTQETAGIEEKAKLKAKIETDIVKLKAERASHESVVVELAAAEKKLAKTQHDVTELLHKQTALIQDIKEREERRDQLSKEIADKEHKVADLDELEAKRNAVSAMLAELEAKKKLEVTEREVFESFLGVVGSSLSVEAIEKFVTLAPQLIARAKERGYSPEPLRSVIIRDLSGGELEILRCSSCQARFYVDKPAQQFYMGHHCPLCGSSLVVTDVTGPEIIKKALAALAPRVYVVTQVTSHKKAPPKNPEQPVSS